MDEVEKLLDSTTSRVYEANLKLTDLRSAASKLKFTALGLKENATKLQEANVEGKWLAVLEVCHPTDEWEQSRYISAISAACHFELDHNTV